MLHFWTLLSALGSGALGVIGALFFVGGEPATSSMPRPCTGCGAEACSFTMYSSSGSGLVSWNHPEPVPNPGHNPGDGDCDDDPSPPPPCLQEVPCDVTGSLKLTNESATTIRYEIVVNGVGTGWKQIAQQGSDTIDFAQSWHLDCGYRDDDGAKQDSVYEIKVEYQSPGQWNASSATFWMKCTVCDRWD